MTLVHAAPAFGRQRKPSHNMSRTKANVQTDLATRIRACADSPRSPRAVPGQAIAPSRRALGADSETTRESDRFAGQQTDAATMLPDCTIVQVLRLSVGLPQQRYLVRVLTVQAVRVSSRAIEWVWMCRPVHQIARKGRHG